MTPVCYYEYIPADGAELFTMICKPAAEGTFPVMIMRSPYVDAAEHENEQDLCDRLGAQYHAWLNDGYVVVQQHCRGRGKSSGDCIPYIHEREDGLLLQDWIRRQPFYNGELYLCGGSYCASVHFVTAPFAPDIKAAVLEVQDQSRYNCNYRNGFYKSNLHGGWYMNMYKKKSMPYKAFTPACYQMLPLIHLSESVFGEAAEDFNEILLHPEKDDPFWKESRFGGCETIDAVNHADIPLLLQTGFYDIYTGGIFDMWHALDDNTKAKSALLVHPYAHNGVASDQPVAFENGEAVEQFGDFERRWFNAVRGKEAYFIERGQVTYFPPYENHWHTDDFADGALSETFTLGDGAHTYRYNPAAPASFAGGLSANFGGTAWQDEPNSRYDILSFFTPPFEKDTFVKGKMTASLTVSSDCEDTCFYMRLSLTKEEGYYGLRDDITKISNVDPTYTPHSEIVLPFTFDEHAFLVKQGERLRIDVSSSAFPHYVSHTNNRGPFALQTTAKVATNTVYADRSSLTIRIISR